eukprot:TRINITY_DN16165_c0_g1_i1.p1 TRINITY_DN16165_c0_g1~~TRINITY_DN16165_c0_g1_i1.p1  ORF type:complete len:842 (+),score=201.85 TRINITY_DN16165_c0_g1_i1:70-2595(+)
MDASNVSPPAASAADNAKAASSVLKPALEFVEELENGLAEALRTYREHAEDALIRHLEALQRCENARQAEVGVLQAENAMLRQRLGISVPTDAKEAPTLIFTGHPEFTPAALPPSPRSQGVALAANFTADNRLMLPGQMTQQDSRHTDSQRKEKASQLKAMFDQNENMGVTMTMGSPSRGGAGIGGSKRSNLNKIINGVGTSAGPGGSWQHFIAWVPDSANVKQGSWQPAPTSTLSPNIMGPRKSVTISANLPNLLKQSAPPTFKKPLLRRAGTNMSSMTAASSGLKALGDGDESDSDGSDATEATTIQRESFQVLSCWLVRGRGQKRREGSRAYINLSSDNENRLSRGSSSWSERDSMDMFGQARQTCILHPHSRKRLLWDFCCLALVVYDVIMIPMSAFELPATGFLHFMDWTLRIFWSLDMVMSCRTGVVRIDGSIEWDVRLIVMHYLRTWFPLDCVIVGCDWVEAISKAVGAQFPLNGIRMFRIFRTARLLRLLRVRTFIMQILERVQMESLAAGSALISQLLFVVAASHAMACGWWAIGTLNAPEETWIAHYAYNQEDVWSQYLISFHWSVTLFAGGSEEVTPKCTMERVYAIIMWLFAFLVAKLIVSVLTSSLTQLYIISSNKSRHMANLRSFLKQNGVSSNLVLRIQRSAQHAISVEFSPDAVELLHVISEPMRAEMNYEIYWPTFEKHCFFSACKQTQPQVVRRLCHSATSMLLLSEGDVVFDRWEAPAEPKFYMIVRGTLHYQLNDFEDPVIVEKGTGIAEANLWAEWRHRGNLTIVTDAKIAVMDARKFQEIVSKSIRAKEVSLFDPRQYALDFVSTLNEVEELSDLVAMK